MSGLPCPDCGSELAFLEQYHRHYCYSCGRYAPEGFGDRGAKICPTCAGILSYVTLYDRYYCYRDSAYSPEEAVLQSGQEPVPSTAPSTAAPAAAENQATIVVLEPAKPEPPKTITVEVPAEFAPQPEERAEEEISPEESPAPRAKPPLVRDEILQAKKPLLMNLCKAYDLEPSGPKEEIRQRLLSYLDELESEAQPKEIAEQTSQEPEPSAVPAMPEAETGAPALQETPAESVEEKALEGESTPTPGVETAPAVVETRPAPQSVVETVPAPAAVMVSEPQPAVAEAPAVEPVKLKHPCPTCGRELTHISQYDRWYCYHCASYAPAAKSKFACPNCGAKLRWIVLYERWWCDSCRRYAAADLPKPEGAVAAAAAAVAVERTIEEPTQSATLITQMHRSPGSGIGLVGFGMVLFVVYEILVDLPAVLTVSARIVLAPDVAFGLRFFAFVFVAVGAILGLLAVRDRR